MVRRRHDAPIPGVRPQTAWAARWWLRWGIWIVLGVALVGALWGLAPI